MASPIRSEFPRRREQDDRWLRALADGETWALGAIYSEYHAEVRAFARRVTGDSAIGEDLVHEVFLALPSAVRRLRGECSLRTFLLSIAANMARHHIRSAIRRRAAEKKLRAAPASYAGAADESIDRDRLARALTEALDQLPTKQRLAFILCEVEERSSTDAADIVGATDVTVRARLFHAKRRLRAALIEKGIR